MLDGLLWLPTSFPRQNLIGPTNPVLAGRWIRRLAASGTAMAEDRVLYSCSSCPCGDVEVRRR